MSTVYQIKVYINFIFSNLQKKEYKDDPCSLNATYAAVKKSLKNSFFQILTNFKDTVQHDKT